MTEIALYIALTPGQTARLAAGLPPGFTLRSLAGDEPCAAEIVFGNPDPSVIAANPALRWLQLESVGFGEYAALDWSRPAGPVQVSNLAGFFADPVAESALAGILALGRGIDRLVRLQDRAEWNGDPLRTRLRLLRGARVLLFGHGAINRRLAELLVPFGCTITALARGWTPATLDAALAGADIVAATVPATPATAGIFDAARFAALPPGSIFCNFGRGSLVVEPDLDAALRSGHLGGAVIDVTRDEPLPPGHPFWTAPNLILTQHTGGGTADEIDRKIDSFLSNLARVHAGQPPAGLVNFARGY